MKSRCLRLCALSWFLIASSCRAENTTNVTEVECSADQEEFVAQTEFVLEGSNQFFDSVERNAIQAAFVEIYNRITRDSCDSYFRRLSELTFVSMTNQLNETITSDDTDLLSMLDEGPPQGGPLNLTSEEKPLPEEAPPEDLPLPLPEAIPEELPIPLPDEIPEELPTPPEEVPEPPPQGPPQGPPPSPFGRLRWRRQLEEYVNETTSSSDAGVSATFNVTGTCRDCAVSRSGSFALFDDSFRLRFRFRILSQMQRALESPPEGFPLEENSNGPPSDGLPSDGPPSDGPPSDGILEDGLPTESGNEDCTCVAGLEPTAPQAPQVPQLLEFLNERLQELQEEHGLFQDVFFSDVMQLDDLSGIEEEEGLEIEEGEETAPVETTKQSAKSATPNSQRKEPAQTGIDSNTVEKGATTTISSSARKQIGNFLTMAGLSLFLLANL